ncbi:MAG TPA: prepilin-type N-terminal cleavage/methylation domain-containing protein [Gemmatimonadales bacterium]|nr:prepilin-type N-terminal cleavage/methylation domain-containing protein [Gemmatimonadales bacterium]
MIRRRAGFTLIELLTVLIVIGLLASIALLKYIDLRHRARAAQAVGDLQAVRIAAYSAWYETGSWPGEVGPGVVPPGLVSYLPFKFPFDRPEYTLDWESFVPPGGGPSGSMQVGVVVTSADPRLQTALQQQLGNKLPFLSVGNTLTFVIVGPDGGN